MLAPSERVWSHTAAKRFSQAVRPEMEGRGLHVKKVDNLHQIDRRVDSVLPVTMTVCPLYAPGKLTESQLIAPPLQIHDSRVEPKWRAVSQVIDTIGKMSQIHGFTPLYQISFADQGVILADPKSDITDLMDYHFDLYQQALQTVSNQAYGLRRYSQMAIDFNGTIPVSNDQDQPNPLNFAEILASRGVKIRPDMIVNGQLHPRGEKLVRKLITQVGNSHLALELMTQYGLFDAVTAHPEGLNIYIERESAGLLLQITDLFAHSQYPRIDLIA